MAPTSSQFEGFRGRTQTLGEWLAGFRWILARRSDLWAILAKHRMDPALREAVMVAVAEVNACRYCSYVHQTHALHHGLSQEQVALIAAGSPALGDARIASAIAYARARAETGFAPGAAAYRDQLVEVLGAREADDVEVVARVMHAANLAANAMDALSARMRGQVPAGSRLRDDLVLGALPHWSSLSRHRAGPRRSVSRACPRRCALTDAAWREIGDAVHVLVLAAAFALSIFAPSASAQELEPRS